MGRPAPLSDFSALDLAALARLIDAQALPPVDQWHPERCGPSGIKIARDGTWLHEGGPIRRPEMVRLFSRLLRRELDGRFVLVTPAEMLDVEVEDAPFVAVEVKSEGLGRGRQLAFRLNSGDAVIAGPRNPIRIDGTLDAPRPALEVRGGLEARICRAVYYELAALAIDEDSDPPGLWSGGRFFALGAA